MADKGEGPAIGIDLGTTYSCVGVWQHNRIEIIANDQGNRTTPLYFTFTDSKRLIGEAAMNPINTFFFYGKNGSEKVQISSRWLSSRNIIVSDLVNGWPCTDLPTLARNVSNQALKIEVFREEIFPQLEGRSFSVVYVHTDVRRSENFPRISTLSDSDQRQRRISRRLAYFVHPGLQARLFLTTCDRFLFSGGLYGYNFSRLRLAQLFHGFE